MTLFTIKMVVDGKDFSVDYPTIDAFLNDTGLMNLFEDNFVTKCTIYCGDTRIAAIPLMSWKRLKEQVVSHSSSILRYHGKS